MEALLILLALLAVAAVVASVFKINAYAEAQYAYKPFAVGNFFAVLPAYLLAMGGMMFSGQGSALNAWVMWGAAVLYLLFLLVRLVRRTDFMVALYSLTLMVLAWLPILVLFFLHQDSKRRKS